MVEVVANPPVDIFTEILTLDEMVPLAVVEFTVPQVAQSNWDESHSALIPPVTLIEQESHWEKRHFEIRSKETSMERSLFLQFI